MIRIIINVENVEHVLLAGQAAKFLVRNPDREDALLEYGDSGPRFWVRKNKNSISVWEK